MKHECSLYAYRCVVAHRPSCQQYNCLFIFPGNPCLKFWSYMLSMVQNRLTKEKTNIKKKALEWVFFLTELFIFAVCRTPFPKSGNHYCWHFQFEENPDISGAGESFHNTGKLIPSCYSGF